MALFGPFPTLRLQLATDPRFAAALAYAQDVLDARSAAHARLQKVPAGETVRIELTKGAFALEQTYTTKPRAKGFFESHRRYIDLQLIVAGEEVMEVADISRLEVTAPLAEGGDLIKYADPGAVSVLRLRAGDAAVFFPEDGHMPSLQLAGPTMVRKSVVKVPVAGS
jgi:biofilm protein TabA